MLVLEKMEIVRVISPLMHDTYLFYISAVEIQLLATFPKVERARNFVSDFLLQCSSNF